MKNKFERILFDLDGTITDSKEGIINSLRYAFDKIGEPQPDEDFLMTFLGPPLMDSFTHTMGYEKEKADRALAYFRERFQPLGIYENRLFPGIDQLLHALSQQKSIKVYLATAKPLPSAITVLKYFKIHKYFDDISGATLDGTIKLKTHVIANLLATFGDDYDPERTIMIGDRDHDIYGARDNGIKCAGVAYGYGSAEELKDADYVASDVEDLKALLLGGR